MKASEPIDRKISSALENANRSRFVSNSRSAPKTVARPKASEKTHTITRRPFILPPSAIVVDWSRFYPSAVRASSPAADRGVATPGLRFCRLSGIVIRPRRKTMPMTAKKKLQHRRQRRVVKLRALKTKLKVTTDSKTRERPQGKIRRLDPFQPLPKK